MTTETLKRLLEIKAIKASTGFNSATSIYALMRERNFPKPIKIGRTNRWIEAEVQDWIEQQIKASRGVQ